MKKVGVVGVMLFVILSAVSCGRKIQNGPVSAGLIPLTATPTHTPDVNYTVYIHQEGTPAVNVDLQMLNVTKGMTATAKTGPDGRAGFELHDYGNWVLNVGSFNGFKAQTFPVDPFSNTIYAVNYGIPSLELQLVSGSELIPVKGMKLVYKAVYHTKFERKTFVFFTLIENVSMVVDYERTVIKEGDFIKCEIEIPKSFEKYPEKGYFRDTNIEDYRYIRLKASCKNLLIDGPESETRTLEKDWYFNVEADYIYAQIYDYAENFGKIVYYAGISKLYKTAILGYDSEIKCYAIDAANIGNDGTRTPVINGVTMPAFTGYGNFLALAKISTGADNNYGEMRDYNNGWAKVFIYDGVYLSVTRTFKAETAWSTKCFHWCYASSGSGITRANKACDNNVVSFMLIKEKNKIFPWDHALLADVYRCRRARVEGIK